MNPAPRPADKRSEGAIAPVPQGMSGREGSPPFPKDQAGVAGSNPREQEAGAVSPAAVPGRIAGIDYGRTRLGIAITDPERRLASPYENYQRRGQRQDAARFRRLVSEEGVTLFVVGLPVHLDGRQSQQSQEARRFGAWLAGVTGVPVEFFDERFTTVEAEQHLRQAGLTHKRRKARRDMLAAQIMLAAFLESCNPRRAADAPLDDSP